MLVDGRQVVSHATRPPASPTAPSESTASAATRWAELGLELDVADDLDAVAEGPVALDPERGRPSSSTARPRGSACRTRRPACRSRRRGRRTAARPRPGRARSPGRCRRRRSAAPAGRWWSSPARTGRGRPRSARESSNTSIAAPIAVSTWITSGVRPVARVDVLDVADQRQPEDAARGRRARASSRPGRTTGCWSSRTGAGRGRPARPGRRPASARSRAARSGRRSCGARSGRPCGPRAYAAPPRSRTARPTSANQPATRASGTAPRLSELETKTRW